MFIPGFIITWITFPGVIVHELAHQLFCIATGTRVVKVCYFRFGNPAGYVLHETPASVGKHILIGVGPLFVNTGAGLALGLLAIGMKGLSGEVHGVLLWLAISVAMHSFPSTGDAKSIWSSVASSRAGILAKLVGTPLVGLIYLGALGSFVWLDLAYGVGVVVGIPAYFHLA